MILRIVLFLALLKNFKCEELSITCDYTVNGENYVCLINGITITNETRVTEIVGDHVIGKTNNDVTKVIISNSTVYELPSQIWTTFGSLKFLLAPRITLKKVESLENCMMIEELDLSWNELEEFPSKIECAKLKKLDLSWNQLKSFKETQFRTSGNLIEFNLAHNKISSLNGNFLVPLRNLKILMMSSNQLRTLSKSVFDNLVNLEILDIAQNPLQSIENECFVNAGALKSLVITESDLGVLPVDVFKGLENLQSLSIADNKYLNLDSVTFQSLKKLINLRSLSLPRNNIRYINDDTFWDMKNLRTLDLEGNLIENLNPDLFNNSLELSELSLMDNKLTEIKDYSFKSLRNLSLLNLAHNSLRKISGSVFENVTEIRELNLNGNELRSVPHNLFSNSKRLRNLFLDNNYLGSLFDFSGLINLELLGLSKNSLIELDLNGFKNMTRIKGIYLQNNLIQGVPADLFSQNVELTHIHLQNNKILAIQPGAFDNLPNLDFLGLDNNLCVNRSFNSNDGDILKNELTNCNENAWACQTIDRDTCLIENVTYPAPSNSIHVFKDQSYYPKIVFKNSNLTEIPQVVWDFQSLSVLNVESTGIESLGDLSKCGILSEIRAGFNRIVVIPESIRSCMNLRVLDLQGNQIEDVDALKNLYSMRQLSLNDNKIKRIQVLTGSIHYLNLENNLFEYNSVHDESLSFLSSMFDLEVLVLNKNRISYINRNLFSYNRPLREIYLSNNEISRIENESFFTRSLEIVDLRSNICINKFYNETETIRNIDRDLRECSAGTDNDGGGADKSTINLAISVVMLAVLYFNVAFFM